MGYKRIVVAVDGGGASEQALERAVRLARSDGAHLDVLGIDEALPIFAGPRERSHRNGRVRGVVAAAVEKASAAGVDAAGEVLGGYPAEVIVNYATKRASDLIVVGAGGRGVASLGRTADKVVDLARCAVLVVR